MKIWRVVFGVLLSHWARRPAQALLLLLGLAAATALFTGVQALNLHARASYDAASNLIGGGALPVVETPSGVAFPETLFAELRRAGVLVSPIVRGSIMSGGTRLSVLGIDLATAPNGAGQFIEGFATAPRGASGPVPQEAITPQQFLLPPYLGIAAPDTIALLENMNEGTGELKQKLPRIVPRNGVAPYTILMDIGAAQRALGQFGEINSLILLDNNPAAGAIISEISGGTLVILASDQQTTPGDLAGSFHLNLTAFGFLSFLVGLVIVHASVGLAFEQRRGAVRTLRACGASKRDVIAAFLMEILVVGAIAGAAGVAGGVGLAVLIAPDVAETLRGLYGANVGGSIAIDPWWGVLGLLVSIGGGLVASIGPLVKMNRMPILLSAQHEAWASNNSDAMKQSILLALGAIIVAVLIYILFEGLIGGFALMAAVLAVSALLLPSALSRVLKLAQWRAKGSISRWFWADTRQQMPSMSLALQALLIAMAANISVSAMVASFRDTFTGWLDQRLAADIYINAGTPDKARDVLDALTEHPEIVKALPFGLTKTRYGGTPIGVSAFTPDTLYRDYWPLTARTEKSWIQVEAGNGILINEQMAFGLDLQPGDSLRLPTPSGYWATEVAGVFSDYGNTRYQVMSPIEHVQDYFEKFEPSLVLAAFSAPKSPDDTQSFITEIVTEFDMPRESIIDQNALRALSLNIFDQTFVVTRTLSIFTLMVSGLALLTGLTALSGTRLIMVAPVWSIGVNRALISRLELTRTVLICLLTGLFAIPIGLGLAYILTDIINVAAFGWRLPLFHYPLKWAELLGISLVIALLAGAPSVLKLSRTQPGDFVKVFASES